MNTIAASRLGLTLRRSATQRRKRLLKAVLLHSARATAFARRWRDSSAHLTTWGALWVFVVASLATRAAFAHAGFLNVDEAAHLLGARTLLDGGVLYVDFVDNKPPLVYVVYAAAQTIFGEGLMSVRLMGALVLIPGTALAASAFHGHGRRGLASGLAFVVASASLLAADVHAVHCEQVMLLPLAWSVVLMRARRFRRRPLRLLGAGALVGVAALAKQPALAFLAPIALVILLDSTPLARRLGHGALLVVGAALPWAAFGLWMGCSGSLNEAIFWIWRFNASHVDNPMPLRDQLGRVLLFGSGLLPSMLPLGLAWSLGRSHVLRERLWLLALLAAAVVPALLGMRLFGHYFLPAVFILALPAGPFFARRTRLRRHVAVGGLATLCLIVVTAVGLGVHNPAAAIADVSGPSYEHIGRELGARARRDANEACTVFVWGYAPMIYVYADTRAASRFVVPLDSLSGYLAGNDAAIEGRLDTATRIRVDHWDALMADLRARRPCYIVDTAPADLNRWGHFPISRFPRLSEVIDRDYVFDGRVDGATIYARR